MSGMGFLSDPSAKWWREMEKVTRPILPVRSAIPRIFQVMSFNHSLMMAISGTRQVDFNT